MAKRIKIGEPVNEAESWAFDFLSENLPQHYLVITNLEVLAQSGQPLEVDAIVVGEFALYLVDVKGYVGNLRAGVNDWSLDDRWIGNSLSKANYVGRVLAGRIGDRMPRGVRAPWCQGMVLATGREGSDIEIEKDFAQLCVFTPAEIIPALTETAYLTSKFDSPITGQQRDYALEVIGRIGVMASRQNHVQDFEKKRLLGEANGIEIWEASYAIENWDSDWLLKIVQASKAESEEHYAVTTSVIRAEFYRLQQLSGISGVPGCAPLISDGEQLVLPVKRPRGVPLSVFDVSQLDRNESIQILRRAVVSLQQMHARGCTLGSIGANDVFLSDDGDLEFLEIRNNLTPNKDIVSFFKLFRDVANTTNSPMVIKGFSATAEDETADLEDLRLLLSSELVGQVFENEKEFEIAENELVAGRYQLASKIEEMNSAEIWKAKHLAGQFDCAVSIYKDAGQNWPYVNEEFSQLIRLYHPYIERVFDFGVIEQPNLYYISRAWVEGEPLQEAGKLADSGKLLLWFKCMLVGLQYLHSQGLLHRNITPGNMICSDTASVMVNFSGLPAQMRIAENIGYTDPLLAETGWSHESDLYSLILSFLSLSPGFQGLPAGAVTSEALGWAEATFGPDCLVPLKIFLTQRPPIDSGTNYLAYFGLESSSEKIEDLSEEFRDRWNITKGYMNFLVLDMLNDPVPRSRNQWVLHALRSRSIPGNKTNRGSMSATVSRLKKEGIAEDHGKKVKLTEGFWESFTLVQ